ncbi:hypothetical protein PHIN3_144 [Sinorhizobium phage phiN3]|uniref:Uncharacterized protein n=1 Tax=Sinorhizobium phage phiN3 TaxID=1647405 RepID=A0A0F6WCN9_9CAUD|nr:hypothetical protein AVT40_gp389 [Sinorhizobium phage phiN3]AKF13407.1 hypothetical protein PHIN3_144 [Sinorhizobium phage phiN3]
MQQGKHNGKAKKLLKAITNELKTSVAMSDLEATPTAKKLVEKSQHMIHQAKQYTRRHKDT